MRLARYSRLVMTGEGVKECATCYCKCSALDQEVEKFTSIVAVVQTLMFWKSNFCVWSNGVSFHHGCESDVRTMTGNVRCLWWMRRENWSAHVCEDLVGVAPRAISSFFGRRCFERGARLRNGLHFVWVRGGAGLRLGMKSGFVEDCLSVFAQSSIVLAGEMGRWEVN